MAKVSLRAYNQEIEAMIDRGHLDEAIAHCRHILKTFPKHLETYRLLGKAYLEYKRYPEAADIFSRVLVVSPSDFVANVGMSIIRDEENRLDEAIWYMERAFETQPSNAAIQSELQRLYGRREGVQPPRIRMTRGALAHMYVQGELYPQAIAEIKSVLKEDPGRSDMQALLARAYYRSGLKNDAAEAASAALRSNPYNLDANRVLVEILGVDHPESVQAYRQRVVELDPYAAQVTSSIFQANEVPDAAVTLEHLDWNGQPVGMQPDWQTSQAISLEGSPRQEEQPDWLKGIFGGEAAASPPQSTSVSPFDMATPTARQVEPAADIPDFLREAGWGESTGAFDESQSVFAESDSTSAEAPIEQGDLPDWVKAMAPQQPAETPAEEEELPDWINKIGTSELPVPSESSDQIDWMKGLEATSPEQPVDRPDWLQQTGQTEPASSSPDEPDWLKGFGAEPAATPAAGATDDLDWLNDLAQGEAAAAKSAETPSTEFDFLDRPAEPFDAAPAAPATDLPDWMADLGVQPASSSPASSDDFDFLDPLGSQMKTPSSAAASDDDFDFLNELTAGSGQLTPAEPPEPARAGPPGMSEEEQDDSFAWLESLAAKQGATEGLLTRPEERLEDEPDWVKQAKGIDAVQPPVETPPVTEPVSSLNELGKSEQDDTFAWLEGLAAKQGATEGLLTTPEERLEEPPEWIRQASSLSGSTEEVPSAESAPGDQEGQPAVTSPSASLEELGTSEQEREDSFAWLEALAAKQGASEGLLTKPEERPAEEPEWVKQAKDLGESPVLEEPATSRDDTGAWLKSLEEEAAAARERTEERARDDTGVWLRSLDEDAAVPQDRVDETPDWMKQQEEPASAVSEPELAASRDDTGVWLKSLDEETLTPLGQRDETPDWLRQEEPASSSSEPDWLRPEEETAVTSTAETPVSSDDTPTWLKSLEEEELTPQDQPQMDVREPVAATPTADLPASADDTAAWLQSLDEDQTVATDETAPVEDEIETWLKSLDELEPVAAEPAPVTQPEGLPEWMDTVQDRQPAEEPAAAEPQVTEDEVSEWMSTVEAPEPAVPQTPKVDTGSLPSWLRGLEEEKERATHGAGEDLPAWLRDETGELVAEPTRIEPTRATDWHPVEAPQSELEPEAAAPEPAPVEAALPEQAAPPPEQPVDVVAILEQKLAASEEQPEKPAAPPRPQRELTARKVTGALTDPVLAQARNEFSRSNISAGLESYSRLIKKGRLLEDIIFDLREALYRHPVDVDIWQSLGDAYMRSNRLQDALDAYTKAEELLR